jgi:signal transduction histidine kinase
VLFEGEVKAVIELASLSGYTASHLAFLDQLTASIGIVLNSIEATMKTEALLEQSQKIGAELQAQQKELQQTNEQLAQKAQQLADQNAEVERKNQQIEQARRALEDKAEELALTSKYKSEFLANMSHELRTPLNSILILGQQLAENPEQNLTAKQVDFARTIHSAGTDLLNLISDILDLSKIESGTVTVEPADVYFSNLLDTVARPFRHDAETRGLSFEVSLDPELGRSLFTDQKRLQQVLKNLLSNAFKFTEHGGVHLKVSAAKGGWSSEHPVLDQSPMVVAFEVSDTGIGIAPEKQKIIFEAFQQADAGTARQVRRHRTRLASAASCPTCLGGEIQLRSTPGDGQHLHLYLPIRYVGPSSHGAGETARQALVDRPARAFRVVETSRRSWSRRPGGPPARRPQSPVVEDDPHYARVLADLGPGPGLQGAGRRRGTDALELARSSGQARSRSDVFLPDMLGWTGASAT